MLNSEDFKVYFNGVETRNEDLNYYAFAIDMTTMKIVPCQFLACSRCLFNGSKLRFTTCVAARVSYLYSVMKGESADEI